MDLNKIYNEEDLFPKNIALYEQRSYGLLFYNEDNKDSYDSNHAIIYKKNVSDINEMLNDIVAFYREKQIKPIIYQSIFDCGYFSSIKQELADFGFEYWEETQKYMVLSEANHILFNVK